MGASRLSVSSTSKSRSCSQHKANSRCSSRSHLSKSLRSSSTMRKVMTHKLLAEWCWEVRAKTMPIKWSRSASRITTSGRYLAELSTPSLFQPPGSFIPGALISRDSVDCRTLRTDAGQLLSRTCRRVSMRVVSMMKFWTKLPSNRDYKSREGMPTLGPEAACSMLSRRQTNLWMGVLRDPMETVRACLNMKMKYWGRWISWRKISWTRTSKKTFTYFVQRNMSSRLSADHYTPWYVLTWTGCSPVVMAQHMLWVMVTKKHAKVSSKFYSSMAISQREHILPTWVS